jgi:hypothetical protein
VLNVLTAHLVGGVAWVLVVALTWLSVLIVYVCLLVHSFRYATLRATGIYGNEWQSLSEAERAARWRAYCQQWWPRQYQGVEP